MPIEIMPIALGCGTVLIIAFLIAYLTIRECSGVNDLKTGLNKLKYQKAEHVHNSVLAQIASSNKNQTQGD